jgi:hypothetical protein
MYAFFYPPLGLGKVKMKFLYTTFLILAVVETEWTASHSAFCAFGKDFLVPVL